MSRGQILFCFPLDDHSVDTGLAGLEVTELAGADAQWFTSSQSSSLEKRNRARAEARVRVRRRSLLVRWGISLASVGVGALAFFLGQSGLVDRLSALVL